MPQHSTILIADDHPLLLNGLQSEMEQAGFKNIIVAKDGLEACRQILEHKPDIAILDIEMPVLTAFEVIEKAIEAGSQTKYIILTSHKEHRFVIKAEQLNISGYILKDEPFEELEKCIRVVHKGNSFFSESFNNILQNTIAPEQKKMSHLSPSERTILRLVAQGKSSNEIAETLRISQRTVQKHRANMISKLGLPSSQQALVEWCERFKQLILKL